MAEWVVTVAEAGMRLDRWLVGRARVTRGTAKRGLDQGSVRVNGRKVVLAKWALQPGDRVRYTPAARTAAQRERAAGYHPLDVLYEDRDLLAVVKPSGVLTLSESAGQEESMVDRARAYLRRKYRQARGTFVKALHRLDRETSGVLLLAKSKTGEGVIQQFKQHRVLREYRALVHGPVEQEQGTIDLPLVKGEFGHGRKVAPAGRAQPSAKGAITHYWVEERYSTATYLRIQVETGRTHQIRVHLAAIGHPLLGDRRYGPPDDPVPAPRQALHATRLGCRHPATGEPIELHAPPPPDFAAMLDALRDSV